MNLLEHQKEDSDWIIKQKRTLNASDMGTMKSLTALVAIQKAGWKRVLICCSAALKQNWRREIEKWFPDWNPVVLEGLPVARGLILEGFTDTGGILIINYEQIRANRDGTYTEESNRLMKMGFDFMVVDEAHYIKSRPRQPKIKEDGSKAIGQLRSRGVHRLARKIPHVCLMTGTPIMNAVPELWSYLHIIDPAKWSSYWKFVKEHCEITSDFYSQFKVGDKAIDPGKLRREIAPVVRRRLKEDVLDLPPVTYQQLWVDLKPKEQALYDKLKKEWYAEFEAKLRGRATNDAISVMVLAPVVIALITRLKQVAVAPDMMVEGGIGWHTAKMEMLLQLVEGTDEKVVVFSQFRRAIDLAEEMCVNRHIGYMRYTGSENTKEREESLRRFGEEEKCRLGLVTLAAGGVGLNGLQVAPYAVFLDKAWTPAMNEQAVGRLDRPGQKKPVTIYEILARCTIEERIERMLNHKENLIAEIIRQREKVFA